MMFKFWKKDSASEAYFEKFQSILTRMEAAMSDSVHSGSISCLILVQFLPYQQAALEAAQNVLLHTEEEGMWRFASQIVAEQKANIESMQAMLCACTRLEDSRRARHRYQRQMVDTRLQPHCVILCCARHKSKFQIRVGSNNFVRICVPLKCSSSFAGYNRKGLDTECSDL